MGVAFRMVRVRKDGEESTFTDYKGERKTSKYEPVCTVFETDGKYSVKFEEKFAKVIGTADNWINFYVQEEREGSKRPAAKTSAKRPSRKSEPEDEEEEDDIF